MTTRSGRKYNSVVAQPQGETADMGETSEAIAAMQELFRNLLDDCNEWLTTTDITLSESCVN